LWKQLQSLIAVQHLPSKRKAKHGGFHLHFSIYINFYQAFAEEIKLQKEPTGSLHCQSTFCLAGALMAQIVDPAT
jgi:hypothetical protein